MTDAPNADARRDDELNERGNALVSPLSARERAKEEKALKKARAAAIAALRYADDCLDSEDVAFALSDICELYGHPLSDEEKVRWGLLDETVVAMEEAQSAESPVMIPAVEGRELFYEGTDPKNFVAEMVAKFDFDPSRDNPYWNDRYGYIFHCPGHLMDKVYGGGYPLGS